MGCGPSGAPAPAAKAPAPAAPAPAPAAPAASPAAASPVAAASPAAASSPAAAPSPAAVAAASPSPAAARSPLSVPANDPAIETADVTFPGDGGASIMAYQARPRTGSDFPLVLIVHENRGLTDHIQDVTRRYAREGYVGLAVDLLSREGGTTKVADPARIPALLDQAGLDRHVSDFQAALRYGTGLAFVKKGASGMTGFCFGGGIVWRAVTRMPDLKAAVPWYGPPPPTQDVPNIKAAMLGIYSSDPQDFANNGKEQLEAALKQANVTYEFKTYPNTRHAFNNDQGERYNQEAALAAWRDTMNWFGKYLKGATGA
jgi:carboxymethylenebutenolidase